MINATGANGTSDYLRCRDVFEIPVGLVWFSRIVLWSLIGLQLIGNGLIIYVIAFCTKLTKANAFILSFAISDWLSGIGAIIGAYREETGRYFFDWPIGTVTVLPNQLDLVVRNDSWGCRF